MKTIVILTGAGISAESGLQTFRAADGLWCGHRVEEVATPEGFARNPALVQDFYNMRRRQLKDVMPNAAHLALADLAAKWDGEVVLITQNVDDLHQRAAAANGLKLHQPPHPSPLPFGEREFNRASITTESLLPEGEKVRMRGAYTFYNMHGELKKVRCNATQQVYDWLEDITPDAACACCKRTGTLRPHIVWFGEMPLSMDAIDDALRRCVLFLSIGTSGNVYPAAGFVQQLRHLGRAHLVELNLEPSLGSHHFHETQHGPATETVPRYVEKILRGDVI